MLLRCSRNWGIYFCRLSAIGRNKFTLVWHECFVSFLSAITVRRIAKHSSRRCYESIMHPVVHKASIYNRTAISLSHITLCSAIGPLISNVCRLDAESFSLHFGGPSSPCFSLLPHMWSELDFVCSFCTVTSLHLRRYSKLALLMIHDSPITSSWVHTTWFPSCGTLSKPVYVKTRLLSFNPELGPQISFLSTPALRSFSPGLTARYWYYQKNTLPWIKSNPSHCPPE